MAHQLLCLAGSRTMALIEFAPGRMPLWRHYGARFAPGPLLAQWSALAVQRLAPGAMDRLDGVALLGGFGNGVYRGSGLLAHRDGHYGMQEFVATRFEQEARDTVQCLRIFLRDGTSDPAAQMEAVITLTLDAASDVLRLETCLTNTGQGVLQLDKVVSGSVGVSAHLQDVAFFSGQWAHEFQWHRRPLDAAGWQTHNARGKTSHHTPAACFLLAANADDDRGEVVAAHLGWSGNHHMAVQCQEDGAFVVQGGPWLAPGERRLEPGASFTTAPLYTTWSDHGINGASQNLHRFARQMLAAEAGGALPPRPVHLNTWEAVYFAHEPVVLRRLADQAAAMGLERFVLDDGWFCGRPDDTRGLGDWWPDPQKYPQGLGPLVDYVNRLGLQFGLWVEPEMVSPDSVLYRQHPDWALQSAGRTPQLGRQQLVLNVARPEVSEYLFDKLHALLSAHPIAYLKWDMNRDLAQAEDAQARLVYHRQVGAVYALMARLRAAHPAVEIESCASGGGRMDFGVLAHVQRFWTSDNNDALSRVAIQSGAARLFPLEVLGSHVGPAPAHTTGRSQRMDFRCAVALFGHMGVEADIGMLGAQDANTLQRWVAHYKQWRHVLHTGTFSQGATAQGVWWLVQADGVCLLNVLTTAPPHTAQHAPLRLAAFGGTRRWRVKLLDIAGVERARSTAPALWMEALQSSGVEISAQELRHAGLPLPTMHPESAIVLVFEQLD